MNADLHDQIVLVTGASGGIGQATSRLLAAEGARVVLHCHRNRSAAETLAGELRRPGWIVQADLAAEDGADRLFAAALALAPRIDAVVVNAGIWPETPLPLHDIPRDRWVHTLRAVLDSAVLTCRAFLRHLAEMPRPAASIVLVGSTAALFGEAGHSDYAVAKAGLTYGLTLSLKNEIVRLAPHGRVNCVCPGWTRTPMAAAGLADPVAVTRAQATMALQKVAEPEDVAAAIVFLTSARLAGHLSGTILPVAGGMEGRLLH